VKILTIDFETYYDAQFSLSKLTTEEYVRGEEFEVIGVAVQINDGEPQWFSGTHEEIKLFLGQFDFEQNIAVAHNAAFDAAILRWHFGISPRKWIDTLSMARALHGTEVSGSLAALAVQYSLGVKGEEVIHTKGKHRADFNPEELDRFAQYCCNDVELTFALLQKLIPTFPMFELDLIDLTVRMSSEPSLLLSVEVLTEHLKEVQNKKEVLLMGLAMQGYIKEDLMSNPKLAEVLCKLGVKPPMKVSPTTKKLTYAFAKNDEEFKALLEHESPLVQAIVSARLGVKSTLEETRTERFISIAERGPMPVPLRYYAAHTGRWGGDDKINLQNLPRKSPLKKAILAPKGYVICDSDSSQIEARTLAWLAGQNDLVQAFEEGRDVYKIMASAIYNVPVEEITSDQRFVGKTTILGSGYGMGANKFQVQLAGFGVDISLEEAQRVIDTYRDTYPKIPKLWTKCNQVLDWIVSDQVGYFGRDKLLKVEGKAGVLLPNGLYIRYPNLRLVTNPTTKRSEYVYDSRKGENKIYGGKVVENVCQALARNIIGEQMLRIARKYRVVMTVHDAIACLIPEDEAATGQEFVELCMRLRPSWALDLPLNCEAKYGSSYGDC